MSCSFSHWKITGYRPLVNVLRVSKAWVWLMAVKWKVILTQIEGGWGSQPLGATGSPGRGKTLGSHHKVHDNGTRPWRCFWGWEREIGRRQNSRRREHTMRKQRFLKRFGVIQKTGFYLEPTVYVEDWGGKVCCEPVHAFTQAWTSGLMSTYYMLGTENREGRKAGWQKRPK